MPLRKIWDAGLRGYRSERSSGGVGSVILDLMADDGEEGRPVRLELDEGTLLALLQRAHDA
jgi:hypothetical protein